MQIATEWEISWDYPKLQLPPPHYHSRTHSCNDIPIMHCNGFIHQQQLVLQGAKSLQWADLEWIDMNDKDAVDYPMENLNKSVLHPYTPRSDCSEHNLMDRTIPG